jgi:hypothetical protein
VKQAQGSLQPQAMLALEVAWRSDRLALVFFALDRQQSVPWHDRLGSGQRPCSYQSTHMLLTPSGFLHARLSVFPFAFSHAFLRNRFRVAKAQSPQTR